MVNFISSEEFVSYLEDTLIPDLRESGSDATADDFEEAVFWIEHEKKVGESNDR